MVDQQAFDALAHASREFYLASDGDGRVYVIGFNVPTIIRLPPFRSHAISTSRAASVSSSISVPSLFTRSSLQIRCHMRERIAARMTYYVMFTADLNAILRPAP